MFRWKVSCNSKRELLHKYIREAGLRTRFIEWDKAPLLWGSTFQYSSRGQVPGDDLHLCVNIQHSCYTFFTWAVYGMFGCQAFYLYFTQQPQPQSREFTRKWIAYDKSVLKQKMCTILLGSCEHFWLFSVFSYLQVESWL